MRLPAAARLIGALPATNWKPLFVIGSSRMRLPVAAKMALAMAGSTGGNMGSPKPVGGKFVFRKWASIWPGVWFIRMVGYWW